jgi:hypothetical protein
LVLCAPICVAFPLLGQCRFSQTLDSIDCLRSRSWPEPSTHHLVPPVARFSDCSPSNRFRCMGALERIRQ